MTRSTTRQLLDTLRSTRRRVRRYAFRTTLGPTGPERDRPASMTLLRDRR